MFVDEAESRLAGHGQLVLLLCATESPANYESSRIRGFTMAILLASLRLAAGHSLYITQRCHVVDYFRCVG